MQQNNIEQKMQTYVIGTLTISVPGDSTGTFRSTAGDSMGKFRSTAGDSIGRSPRAPCTALVMPEIAFLLSLPTRNPVGPT